MNRLCILHPVYLKTQSMDDLSDKLGCEEYSILNFEFGWVDMFADFRGVNG